MIDEEMDQRKKVVQEADKNRAEGMIFETVNRALQAPAAPIEF